MLLATGYDAAAMRTSSRPPHNSLCPHRWPTSGTFKSKGFESAVQMVGVLPILVVAYLCQMSLGHTVRAGSAAAGNKLLRLAIFCCSWPWVQPCFAQRCSSGAAEQQRVPPSTNLCA